MPELSVVIPCLNEEDTIAECVERAWRGLAACGVEGEVIVADNGSGDRSIALAEGAGARVVRVAEKGYGAALQGGIEAAEGRFVLMGDGDASYDFEELPRFLKPLRDGADLVQGCRLPRGGGQVEPGAMPWLHRWIGNPALTALARLFFRTPICDVYCGLRGFSKQAYGKWKLQSTGMEFATEMIIKASMENDRIAEVPITLHRDGRKQHGPHLRTFRDGWRTLRLFLIFAPQWLFLYPGMVLWGIGFPLFCAAWAGLQIGVARLDVHTMLVSGLILLVGFQALICFWSARLFSVRHGLVEEGPTVRAWAAWWTLERGLMVSMAAVFVGVGMIGFEFFQWWSVGFGPLDYPVSLRMVIPGTVAVALGVQAFLGSFMATLLTFGRR